MSLKEFTLITPVIEAASVFKALETAIPSETIKQAIGQTNSQQKRQRKLSSLVGDQFGNRHESVVIGVNENSSQKSR
jgi:hypothetical protein